MHVQACLSSNIEKKAVTVTSCIKNLISLLHDSVVLGWSSHLLFVFTWVKTNKRLHFREKLPGAGLISRYDIRYAVHLCHQCLWFLFHCIIILTLCILVNRWKVRISCLRYSIKNVVFVWKRNASHCWTVLTLLIWSGWAAVNTHYWLSWKQIWSYRTLLYSTTDQVERIKLDNSNLLEILQTLTWMIKTSKCYNRL